MKVDRRSFVHGGVAAAAIGTSATGARAVGQSTRPEPGINADPMFDEPYVDVDEWRDTPFRHRYVHGGFKGTGAKFVMYFPPKEIYQGRFFQPIPPVPLPEDAVVAMFGGLQNTVGFAFDSGGAAVASNLGGFGATANPSMSADPTIGGYRVSAATARYARVMAKKIYGPHRTYGYCFGGSGGGYRSISNLQNSDAFDGGVPFMHPAPGAIPSAFAARARVLRVLHDKFPQVADAIEPGGGDPFAVLDGHEREVLSEVTRFGFPLRTWVFHETMGIGALAILYQTVLEKDPTYFSDFWTKPGYLGKDRPELFRDVRLQHRTRVKRVVTSAEAAAAGLRTPGRLGAGASADPQVAWQSLQNDYGGKPLPVALELEAPPPAGKRLTGTNILVNSGSSKGKMIVLAGMSGNNALFQFGPASGSLLDITSGIQPGDEVQIDNSNFLAFETYYRHTLLGPDIYAANQFRRPDGSPIYPQREAQLATGFVQSGLGSQITGDFHGKMIVLQYMLDWDAHPWFADWYRSRVREALGADFNDRYRLYFVDYCTHGQAPDPTRTVPYIGALQQALRDVAAWVERGVEPLPETRYNVVDAQVLLPDAAAARRGIQAVAALKANGGETARVRVGEPVTFSAVVEAPPGAGLVVSAEWDFQATAEVVAGEQGRYPIKETIAPAPRIAITRTHAFDKPGTYFPALRVHSQRQGNAETPFARVANLGRVRVVVT
jgi:hypothetical protein